jgi:hypothetical protein
MSWLTKVIDLGKVKVGKVQTPTFQWQGEPLNITKMTSSCGCTTPIYIKESGIIRAEYLPGAIPKHLRDKGEYTSTKKIKVESSQGEFSLSFKAIVYV